MESENKKQACVCVNSIEREKAQMIKLAPEKHFCIKCWKNLQVKLQVSLSFPS